MMLALTSHYTATNAKHHRYAATSLRTVPGAGGWRSRRGGASAWVGAGAVRALGSGPGRCERLGRGRSGPVGEDPVGGRHWALGSGLAPGRREARDRHGRRIAGRATEAGRTGDGSRTRA